MIKNCLARIGCLTVIAAVAAAGWWFRDDIGRLWNRLEITSTSVPSEELAARTESRLESFAAGASKEISLSQAELQSLLTYRLGPMFPAGVSEPLVEVRDSTVLLSARVDPREFDALASREMIERFLADSARVVAELVPGVLQPGVAGLQVLALQAGGLAVPSLMVPWVLQSLELEGVEAAGMKLLVPLPVRVLRFEVSDGAVRLELQ